MDEEKKVEMRKERIKKWLKDPYHLALLGIVLLAVVIRLYYFFLTTNQPLWWDEAEYLLKAKNIAFGTPETGWGAAGRPILFSFIAAGFFKIGLGELGLRFVFVILSISNILLIFYIGKYLFGKREALIAAFLYSLFYLDLFYTSRMLEDMPQVFFVLLSLFFFTKGYLEKSNVKYTYFVIPALVVGILFRFTVGLFAIVLVLFLFLAEGAGFLKKKEVRISIFLGILAYLPYWIWSYFSFNSLNPFHTILYVLTTSTASNPWQVFMNYVSYFPSYMFLLATIVFLIGLVFLVLELVLSYDLVRKSQSLRNKLLILIWIVVPFIYFAFFVNHFEDRYIFMIFPAVFFTLGFILEKAFIFLKKFSKTLAILVIFAVIAIAGFQMFSYSNSIVKDKLTSYSDLKNAGLWIKENSLPSDIVFSAAIPEITYYSERATYKHQENLSSELDALNKNKTVLLVTNWERDPPWLYDYLSQNQTTFAIGYQSVSEYHGQKVFAIVFSRSR